MCNESQGCSDDTRLPIGFFCVLCSLELDSSFHYVAVVSSVPSVEEAYSSLSLFYLTTQTQTMVCRNYSMHVCGLNWGTSRLCTMPVRSRVCPFTRCAYSSCNFVSIKHRPFTVTTKRSPFKRRQAQCLPVVCPTARRSFSCLISLTLCVPESLLRSLACIPPTTTQCLTLRTVGGMVHLDSFFFLWILLV